MRVVRSLKSHPLTTLRMTYGSLVTKQTQTWPVIKLSKVFHFPKNKEVALSQSFLVSRINLFGLLRLFAVLKKPLKPTLFQP